MTDRENEVMRRIEELTGATWDNGETLVSPAEVSRYRPRSRRFPRRRASEKWAKVEGGDE